MALIGWILEGLIFYVNVHANDSHKTQSLGLDDCHLFSVSNDTAPLNL